MCRTCLIAEDSPPIVLLLRTYATMSGYRSSIATVGERVLELVRQEKPDIILLNAELPGKTRGWEVLRILKMDAAMRTIPVIAFWLDPDGQSRHSASEADAALSIPMNYETFRDTVELTHRDRRVR